MVFGNTTVLGHSLSCECVSKPRFLSDFTPPTQAHRNADDNDNDNNGNGDDAHARHSNGGNCTGGNNAHARYSTGGDDARVANAMQGSALEATAMAKQGTARAATAMLANECDAHAPHIMHMHTYMSALSSPHSTHADAHDQHTHAQHTHDMHMRTIPINTPGLAPTLAQAHRTHRRRGTQFMRMHTSGCGEYDCTHGMHAHVRHEQQGQDQSDMHESGADDTSVPRAVLLLSSSSSSFGTSRAVSSAASSSDACNNPPSN